MARREAMRGRRRYWCMGASATKRAPRTCIPRYTTRWLPAPVFARILRTCCWLCCACAACPDATLGVPGSHAKRRVLESGMEEGIGGMASHAWAEVFIPGAGWFGLDPTAGRDVDLRHVRVAYGRDYGDVAPVRGVYKGHAGQRLSVDVRVLPALDDDGREQLNENKAASAVPPVIAERAQQPAQQ